jgi:hypothetical protein
MSVKLVNSSLMSASQPAHTGELSSPPAKVISPAPMVNLFMDRFGHEKTRRAMLGGFVSDFSLYKNNVSLSHIESQNVLFVPVR